MPEIEPCPLRGLEMGADIPGVCLRQCEGLWDKSINEGHVYGDYDHYDHQDALFKHSDNGCSSLESPDIEFSHETLQGITVGNKVLRLYSIVDRCAACGYEYGEQSYVFECPHITNE